MIRERVYITCPPALKEWAEGFAAAEYGNEDDDTEVIFDVRADCPRKVYVTDKPLEKFALR